jgi:hypothetical protein
MDTEQQLIDQLNAHLQSRLGHMNDSRLKRVLMVCGLAAGVVAAIIALLKSIPIGLAILSVLGLGVVVRFLQELRRLSSLAAL